MKISWDYMTYIYITGLYIETVHVEYDYYIIKGLGGNKYLLLATLLPLP